MWNEEQSWWKWDILCSVICGPKSFMSFVKSPLAVSENIQASEHLRTMLQRERGEEGREILFTAFPLVFSPHEKNGIHVTEWIKEARVHCLQCWLWGRLNGVVVNNYITEIALLCITLGVACFVDASDLWRQITPPCVNHFVKVNQAVFHNSFWPLGYNLTHQGSNLLLSGTLGATFSWGIIFSLGDSFIRLQWRSIPIFSLPLSFFVYVSKRGKFRLQIWKVDSQVLCFWHEKGLSILRKHKEAP